MTPQETNPGRATCANGTCARPAEPGELYCEECGLERSLYLRDGRDKDSALRETARRLFGG
jgi:hypothetical protein